jgi:hypothetical protein
LSFSKSRRKEEEEEEAIPLGISGFYFRCCIKKNISIILGFQRAEKQKSGYNNKKRMAGEKEKETYQLGFERCWLER